MPLKLQGQPLNIIFLECKLQWLPLLLLEGTLHFPPQHSISWRDDKMLPFHATYGDLTTLQYAHLAAASLLAPLSPLSPALLFNKQCACMTYSRFPPCFAQCDEQLNGVTVNRGGSAALLWQHSFDVEVVVLGCHVLPFCSFSFACSVWISPQSHIGEANWHDLKVRRRHASCRFPLGW